MQEAWTDCTCSLWPPHHHMAFWGKHTVGKQKRHFSLILSTELDCVWYGYLDCALPGAFVYIFWKYFVHEFQFLVDGWGEEMHIVSCCQNKDCMRQNWLYSVIVTIEKNNKLALVGVLPSVLSRNWVMLWCQRESGCHTTTTHPATHLHMGTHTNHFCFTFKLSASPLEGGVRLYHRTNNPQSHADFVKHCLWK